LHFNKKMEISYMIRKLKLWNGSPIETAVRDGISRFCNAATAQLKANGSRFDSAAQGAFERMVKDFSTSAQEMGEATHSHLKTATTEPAF